MYAGRKVEEATVGELFARPLHPYTRGLLASIPRLDLMRGESRRADRPPAGDPRHRAGADQPARRAAPSRRAAPFADDRCRREYPPYEEKRPGHWAACWHSDALYGAGMLTIAHERRAARRRCSRSKDLKKHFPVAEGPAAPHRRPCLRGRRRQLHDRRRARRSAWSANRLRQVHGRPRRPAPDRADRRHASGSTARDITRLGKARAAPLPRGRCRSSSRTRSPRSIRA